MKKVVLTILMSLFIVGSVFATTFEMYQPVDDFGDPVGEKSIKSKVLNGTYKTANVQDGKMSFTISIQKGGVIQIRIVEAGNTGNLVGVKYTSDIFTVTIRPDSGSDVTAYAYIKQGNDKKYNILQFSGASALAAFTDHKSIRIVIKNDRATYSLGTVDTSEVEGLYYDKALNGKIDSLLASKNYEEVIRLINAEGNTATAIYYGFAGKLNQAEKVIYLDKAQDLYNKGKYEEVMTLLSEMEVKASGTYRKYKTEISNLLTSCEKAVFLDEAQSLYNKGKYEEVMTLLSEMEVKASGTYRKYVDEINNLLASCRRALGKFEIGDRGPAGGWIFYDCDEDNAIGNADGLISTECGWRFLEAAPEDLSGSYEWGPKDGRFGTETGIGTGKSNTDKIPATMGVYGKTAVQACSEYSINGYDDWFLPSKDELKQMYLNLERKGIGGFSSGSYLSSSESSFINGYAWAQYFSDGNQISSSRDNDFRVRPVRAF